MEEITLNEIHRDVEDIKRQLNYLSSVLVEQMTEEDKADLEQALREYKAGKTKSIEAI